jgi:hypothetical protein
MSLRLVEAMVMGTSGFKLMTLLRLALKFMLTREYCQLFPPCGLLRFPVSVTLRCHW